MRASLCLFTLVTCLATPEATRAADRPNVLFIAVDDLNDWIGCLGGHPQVKTPHMDRLASRGTLFTNAHCQAPLCNPSRTSVMTGLRPSTTGVYALGPWLRNVPALKDVVTLPQHFEANGYRTVCTGKIFHDGLARPRSPGNEFSEWGFEGGWGPMPKQKFVHTPDDMKLMDWGPFPARDEDADDAKVADWAVGRIKAMKPGEPTMLCVGFRRPHVPCYAPQKWFDLYPDDDSLVMPPVKADDRDDVPRFAWYLHWKLPEPRLKWLQSSNQWRPLVRAYLASISFVDGQVGRLLGALDESGQADRTVIVLWSDHGWHVGEKGISGKNTLWERSTRVPLIIAGPGVAKGAKCESPAELVDLYPTLAELCGLPRRDGLDGHSLVPQLRDAKAPRERPAITTHGPDNHAVRTDRWRYIRYADGSEELYDHRSDPNEWSNLAADPTHALTKAELARWLPQKSAEPVSGRSSTTRLIDRKPDGRVFWEGKPVGANDPVP
jgi:arylsulfatase A-like enzyme